VSPRVTRSSALWPLASILSGWVGCLLFRWIRLQRVSLSLWLSLQTTDVDSRFSQAAAALASTNGNVELAAGLLFETMG
jgi:hypothetical protein